MKAAGEETEQALALGHTCESHTAAQQLLSLFSCDASCANYATYSYQAVEPSAILLPRTLAQVVLGCRLHRVPQQVLLARLAQYRSLYSLLAEAKYMLIVRGTLSAVPRERSCLGRAFRKGPWCGTCGACAAALGQLVADAQWYPAESRSHQSRPKA